MKAKDCVCGGEGLEGCKEKDNQTILYLLLLYELLYIVSFVQRIVGV